MAKQRSYSKQQLVDAVASSFSIRQVLEKLGLAMHGGNYGTIHRTVAEEKLDTSHFTGQNHAKGKKFGDRLTLSQDVLVKGGTLTSSRLKKILLREGIMAPKCTGCLLETWLGLPIPLELDHINGDSSDNRLENVRLLCPNCHAQTPTYRGKNKKKSPLMQRW